MRNLTLWMAFSIFIFIPGITGAMGLEFSLGVWNQDPEGYASYKRISSSDELDIDRDLNFDSETKLFGRLKIDMPLILPNIYIMATPSKFEGDGNLTRNFKFGNYTFSASVPFSSMVRLDHYDIALFYGIPGLKTMTMGKLNVEAGINARIIDFEAEVSQPLTGLKASKSATIPVPMVYLGAQFKPVSLIGLEAEIRGIAYSSNHYYDLIGRVKVRPLKMFFIAGGYRYENLKIDYSDILGEVKIKGPFLEAGIEF